MAAWMSLSEFTAERDGVKPVRFHEVDTIKNEPEVRFAFDWTTNVASGTVGSEDVTSQLDGISHDNVSIQYALMYDLLNGRLQDTYVLFDVDKMRVANVRNIGTQEIKTKAGTFEAVGIQHQKEGSSRVTTLWCAPELGYLPVVIEQHRKKKLNFRATLTSTAQRESTGVPTGGYPNRIESCSTSSSAAVNTPAARRLAPHLAIIDALAIPANTGTAGNTARHASGYIDDRGPVENGMPRSLAHGAHSCAQPDLPCCQVARGQLTGIADGSATVHCCIDKIIVVVANLVDRAMRMTGCDAALQQALCQSIEIGLTHFRGSPMLSSMPP